MKKNINTGKTYNNDNDLVKTEILGVGVTNASSKNILEYVLKNLKKSTKPYYITTPNPEMIVLAHKNPEFKSALNKAKIALCDGMQLFRAAQLLGRPLKERVTGVDFIEHLCKQVVRQPITVGFLGGRGNVAEEASECLQRKYPGLKVSFVGEEWNSEGLVMSDKGLRKEKFKEIHHSSLIPNHSVDILFVAFGFPKQELWMANHVEKIPVRVMIGIGGAFDYISGKVPRAPKFIQSLGFEWLYRLIIQPWRWRRQLGLIAFLWLVIKDKWRKSDTNLSIT